MTFEGSRISVRTLYRHLLGGNFFGSRVEVGPDLAPLAGHDVALIRSGA